MTRKLPPNIYIHTVGCAKNLVDSELLDGLLPGEYIRVQSAADADVVVINSCGFIEAAREESIDAVMHAVHRKELGDVRAVYMMGCMSQLYREEIRTEIPELDGIYGVNEFGDLLDHLDANTRNRSMTYPTGEMFRRRPLHTPSHYAWLRIADGCDQHCSYCVIPRMRGPYRSRPIDEIVTEAAEMLDRGVLELNFIAQEINSYGKDLNGQTQLVSLLKRLDRLPGHFWLRLLYTHPPFVDDALLTTIARSEHIVPYLDFPVEHLVDSVLKRMNRQGRYATLKTTIDRFRELLPDGAVRTAIITGFPGETDDDFELLLERVQEIGFDRLGAFVYSPEEGAASTRLPETVPAELGQQRLDRLMQLQSRIALARNRQRIGTRLEILTEEVAGEYTAGRTPCDAPEVDNEVLLEGEFPAGHFMSVRITDATEYDLMGEPLE